MNTYEIESKLRDKVDMWQFYNLQSENQKLHEMIRVMDNELNRQRYQISNQGTVIDKILDALSTEDNMITDHEIFNLKQQLY